MMKKVAEIRSENIKITRESIVYFWWFKINCFEQLLGSLNEEINHNKIKLLEIGNDNYGLLYIGKGKNGHERLINYHIHDSQNFHGKGVQNGRLSSLRQTICGLLELPMSTSKTFINEFMNENCLVDYYVCDINQLDIIEHKEIRGNYLPLNYQNTKDILSEKHRRILSDSKKRMRR